ncbi:inversin [Ambystoma mexicanum]|uniref:inversin n=1 Tax=Ambystoma mexicanum TaxID=8296 RepID=UPI0037E95D7C
MAGVSPENLPGDHQPASAVHAAAVTGDKRVLEKHLTAQPELKDREDQLGRTPLMYCVLADRLDCAALLLKAGADVNRADRSRRSALHLAAQTGNYRFVKLLLARRADWMQKDSEETTPLHLATRPKSAKCLALLLKHMAPGEVDAQDRNKQTALHWSAYHNNPEHGRLLIRHNSNIGIPDVDGRIPLHWAAHSPDPGAVHMVRCILDAAPTESLLNWQDYEGRTPLHFAVAAGNESVVEALTSYQGCRVMAYDNLFRTPLHWAALLGHASIARRLLDRHREGAVPSDGQGATPLHYAAQSNYPETVEVFLRHPTGCDDADLEGRTAFMWAAGKGSDDVVRAMLVLKPELDVNLADRYGGTALHAASLAGHVSTVRLLLEQGARADASDLAKQTPLFRACEMGHQTVVQALIEGGARVDLVDQDGRSPLHWAALGGNANVCRILMENAIDPNVRDSGGRTPLQCAAHGGYITCMAALLESKADANVQDKEGRTALHWSCNNGYLDAVKLLLAFDAFPNQMENSEERYTPLDYALLGEHHQVVQFMLERGALSIAAIQDIASTRIQAVYKGYKVRRAFQERKILLMKHELLRKGAAAKKREEGHRRRETEGGIIQKRATAATSLHMKREDGGADVQPLNGVEQEVAISTDPQNQMEEANKGTPKTIEDQPPHKGVSKVSPRAFENHPPLVDINERSPREAKAAKEKSSPTEGNTDSPNAAKDKLPFENVNKAFPKATKEKPRLKQVNDSSHKAAKDKLSLEQASEGSPKVAKDKHRPVKAVVGSPKAIKDNRLREEASVAGEEKKRTKDTSQQPSKCTAMRVHLRSDRGSEGNRQVAPSEVLTSAESAGRMREEPQAGANSQGALGYKNLTPSCKLSLEGPRPVSSGGRCQAESASSSGRKTKAPRSSHAEKAVQGLKPGKDLVTQGFACGRCSPAGSSRPGSAKGGLLKINDTGIKGSNMRKNILPSLPCQAGTASCTAGDVAMSALLGPTIRLKETQHSCASSRLWPSISWHSQNIDFVPTAEKLAVIQRERARKELFRKKAHAATVIQEAWWRYKLKQELSQLLSVVRHSNKSEEKWRRRTTACIIWLVWGKHLDQNLALPVTPCRKQQTRRVPAKSAKPPSVLQQVYGNSQDGKRLRPCRPTSRHRLSARDLILGGR